MSTDQHHSWTCPPLTETSSHREKPCRYEQPIRPKAIGQALEPCPYRPDCDRFERGPGTPMSRRLARVYTPWIKVTLSEPSSSIVVRSEHQFHRREGQRHALRKHLYEVVATREDERSAPTRFGLGCTALVPGDKLGHYLGFVDLRLYYEGTPLAMGLLALPRRLREDPDTFVITGEYGPIFGAHGFSSSVYSMHDSITSGARCAQACVIMSLGMLADRGARMIGSYEITYLAKSNAHAPPPPVPAIPGASPNCLSSPAIARPNHIFRVTGLTGPEIELVLRKSNASPLFSRLERRYSPSENGLSERLALRLIQGYLYARFPVILLVDSETWYQSKCSNPGHAVTLVGVRNSSVQNPEPTFIVHDPGYLPFFEKSVADALEAGYQFSNKEAVRFVAVADFTIRRHAYPCVNTLLKGADLANFQPYLTGERGNDYRINLVHRDDLRFAYFSTVQAPPRIERHLKHLLPRSRYWCVSGYETNRVNRVWLFNASPVPGEEPGQLGDRWLARVDLGPDGIEVVWKRDANGMPQVSLFN